MVSRSNVASIFLATVLAAGPAAAQEIYRSEVSGQFFGSFVSSTTYGGVRQTATDTGGALGSYRFMFNDYAGVEFNYGWSPGTQKYNYFGNAVGVRADTDEATAAFVFRYPGHRFKPFGLIGVGALVFDPQSAPATVQARSAFVYGAGFDIGLGDRFFIRTQYRGLVYNSPDFNTYFLGPDRLTHRAEPSIGFGFKF